jgi:hypothetical protein
MPALYFIFLIKCFIIYLTKRRYGTISLPFFILVVFFFYSQCFFIDYVLFGIEEIGYGRLGTMSVFSDDYLYIVLLYLTFFLGFISILLFADPPRIQIKEVHVYTENKLYNVLLLIGVCLLIIYVTKSVSGYGRLEKMEFFTSNKLLSIPINVATFGWLILFFKNLVNYKRSISFYILSIAIVGYGLIEGGREIFIYILFAYLFSRERTSISFKEMFLGIVSFILITFWKIILVYIIKLNDLPMLLDFVQRKFQFSFTGLDPKNSLLMIRNFIHGDPFFDQFQFSYIINTVKQILRTFNLIEYDSIGESIAFYYIPQASKNGAGLASSGILESMLNFWYFGPIILGIILGWIALKVYYLKYKSTFLYGIMSLFLLIICIKLVRTELAVVLKIYFLPMVVAYFFFYKLSFSKRIRDVKF